MVEAPVLIAALAGLASHLFFYIHGEHHMIAPVLFYSYIALIHAIFFYQLHILDYAYIHAVQNTASIVVAYMIPLFASMTVYRTCFHRLRSFPGPVLARVTKFWHVYQARHSLNYLVLQRLHSQYGPFVRTGPSEITVFTAEALPAVNGPQSSCSKSAWYDLIQPLRAIISTRSKVEHKARRRIWEKGFSQRALRGYEGRVVKYGEQMDRLIATNVEKPICVNDCFFWYSFDVMGDLALGASFEMLVHERWHYAIAMMRKFMWLYGPFSAVPWLARIGFSIPGAAQGWKDFIVWCRQRMTERIMNKVERPDVSSWLIEASKESNTLDQDRDLLDGDAIAMIIAGSDSVGLTLTYIFYHLASSSERQDSIRSELSTVSSISDIQALRHLPHLQSIIMETLRLYPPVPTSGLRDSGPEGLNIGGTYIPPQTTLVVPRWVIARIDSNFEQAADWIPERWTSRTEMVLDKRGYAPFSQGQYDCVGKNLALNEISYLTARILCKYQVELPSGEDGTRVWKDMKDQFTAIPGRLNLVFKPCCT